MADVTARSQVCPVVHQDWIHDPTVRRALELVGWDERVSSEPAKLADITVDALQAVLNLVDAQEAAFTKAMSMGVTPGELVDLHSIVSIAESEADMESKYSAGLRTEAAMAAVKELYRKRFEPEQIATLLGLSPDSVAAYIASAKLGETSRNILDLHRQGLSTPAIARQLNITRQTVSRVLEKHDLTPNKNEAGGKGVKQSSDEQDQRIWFVYNQLGQSPAKTAKALDMELHTVRNAITRIKKKEQK